MPNVLSPRDLVSRPDIMDKTVLSSSIRLEHAFVQNCKPLVHHLNWRQSPVCFGKLKAIFSRDAAQLTIKVRLIYLIFLNNAAFYCCVYGIALNNQAHKCAGFCFYSSCLFDR